MLYSPRKAIERLQHRSYARRRFRFPNQLHLRRNNLIVSAFAVSTDVVANETAGVVRGMKQDDPMDAAMGSNTTRRDTTSAGSKPDAVTTGLQQLFASIAEEPIPDDFLKLLDEIEARSQGTKQ
jgi:hypothetical protein